MQKYRTALHHSVFWARIVSDIFSPLLLPVIVLAAAMLIFKESTQSAVALMAGAFVFGLFIPLLGVFIILKWSASGSVDFDKRGSRHVLYLIAIASYSAGAWLVWVLNLPEVYLVIVFTYLINLIAAFILNLRWKVSVHVGSLFSSIVLLSWIGLANDIRLLPIVVGLIFFLISPLIFWARRKLNVHTPRQLFLGAATGTVVSLVVLFYSGNL